MGKLSRTKGLGFERWVAKKFRRLYPDAGRKLEYQTRHADGVDLENTGEFKVQCKRGRRYASLSKLKEVQLCPIDGGTPLLVTKGDDQDPVVALYFSDFMRLVKKAERG